MKNLFLNVCISGFTQHRGRFHGLLRLRERLYTEGYDEGINKRIWYEPWTTNWERLAADVSLTCNRHGWKPVVNINGYSYGGWGSIQFCRELESIGVPVQTLTLCDPVGRPWYWPRPLPAATSLVRRGLAFSLKIPKNVNLVNEFYQRKNRPQGHELELSDSTEQGESKELYFRHQDMDDAEEFHQAALQAAENSLLEFGGN